MNSERVKESFKKATAAYRQSNTEKVKRANEKYRKSNANKVKDSFKRATGKYRRSNAANVKNQYVKYRKSKPENVKKSCTKATAAYRYLNREKVTESSKNSSRIYRENYPERVHKIFKNANIMLKGSYLILKTKLVAKRRNSKVVAMTVHVNKYRLNRQ